MEDDQVWVRVRDLDEHEIASLAVVKTRLNKSGVQIADRFGTSIWDPNYLNPWTMWVLVDIEDL